MKKSSQEITNKFLNLIYPDSMELIKKFTNLDEIFKDAIDVILELKKTIYDISNSEREVIVYLNEENKRLRTKISKDKENDER